MNKENLEKEKEQIAKIKHKDSIKYMYFSRYLMIRYIVTIFFFKFDVVNCKCILC